MTGDSAQAASAGAANGRRLGEIMAEIARRPNPQLTLGELVESMGDRGYGLVLAALALPNAMPLYIPGLSAVFGLPLVFVALQLLFGRHRLWLPGALTRRSMARAHFSRMAEKLAPYLARLERALKPRRLALTSPIMERVIGLACIILGLLLSLPIPLTNIPLTIPLVLLGVGLAERDGTVVAIGLGLGALVTITVLTLSGALILAAFGWILTVV
jgi:hypothetical protein